MPLYARILKSEIKKFAIDDNGDVKFKHLTENTQLIQKMKNLLLNKLEDYLDQKSEEWTFEFDPDAEDILEKFIKEEVTSEFIDDNFHTEFNEVLLNKLHEFIFDNFDDLYDEIDSRIEDKRNYYDENKEIEDDLFRGTGMSQQDFL